MNKAKIIDELRSKYGAFAEYVASLSEDDFVFSLHGEKWAAGQQIEHLCLSVEPLVKGLRAPEFALKAMFGKADHPSASYAELVARYRSELAAGGTAPASFRPDEVAFARKEEFVNTLRELVEKLCAKIEKFDEERLDIRVLPHPLLGKLTMREMFYFTIYHSEHHHKLTVENLAARVS
ncbi:MAG TPA: DinB family protein [Pyrinomonadaceae bacterium]|nr:DinB family protein [Pyrinomonadaceae bacterium]